MLITILFSFLGGMILNFMPCVLPILSLKILSIVQESSHKKRQYNALLYAMGVMSTFFMMSLIMIIIRQAGYEIGWGYQMQSPYFISTIIVILCFSALQLSDIYLIKFFTYKDKGGSSSPFFNGILITLLSTPCTGPFISTAISYSLSTGTLETLMIFQAIAIGFASPYILLNLNTIFIKMLPKPGAWMNTFKKICAFPLYITIAWLISILVSETTVRIIFPTLLQLILIAMTLWLLEIKVKLKHYKNIIFIVLILIHTNMMYENIVNYGVIPIKIQSEKFSYSKLNEYLANNEKVFVDVTAEWCSTCIYNNKTVIETHIFDKLIKDNNIHFMIADMTNRNEEVLNYLHSLNQDAIPVYAYYSNKNDKPYLIIGKTTIKEITKLLS